MSTLQDYIALPGSKASKIVEQGHDKNALHGRGSAYSRQDADRLFRKLVIDGILFEELKITAMDTTACYIKLGRKANDVLNGKMKVCASRTVLKLYFGSSLFSVYMMKSMKFHLRVRSNIIKPLTPE